MSTVVGSPQGEVVLYVTVAVNHENDTYFENGLVMGYAESSFNRKPGPLSDTPQAGAGLFPPFQK